MSDYDLIIVGGGPAGLAAAAYGLHAQLNVAMIAPVLGGKVSFPFALRNLPSRDTVWGASLVRELEMRVRNNLDHHSATEVKELRRLEDGCFELVLAAGGPHRAASVVLATGARPQRIFVPGEAEFWGRGVSYSAISHAPYMSRRSVAVVGAGERAVNAVLTLAPLADRIHFIVSSSEELRASPAADRAVNHPKVHIFRSWEVQQIAGDEFVTHLELVGVNGETRSLEVDAVFIQLGLIPGNALVRDLVELDPLGFIKVNELCESSVPGLLAAGDATSVHAEQVPVSLGEGSKAALSAWHYLASTGRL